MNAKIDEYGARGILGNGNIETIPIGATDDGRLFVSTTSRLKDVLNLDLSQKRVQELIYTGSYSKIVFAIVSMPIKVNLINGLDLNKYMSIVDKTTIDTFSSNIWLTNDTIPEGKLEIWIWG